MSFGGWKSIFWQVVEKAHAMSLSGESSGFSLMCLLGMGRCLEDGWEISALRIPQGYEGQRAQNYLGWLCGSVGQKMQRLGRQLCKHPWNLNAPALGGAAAS